MMMFGSNNGGGQQATPRQSVQVESGSSFMRTISQSIFGGAVSTSRQQQVMNQQPQQNSGQSVAGPQPTVQIYIDMALKNSTRQPVNEDTTVAEILKSLKQIYGASTLNSARSGGSESMLKGTSSSSNSMMAPLSNRDATMKTAKPTDGVRASTSNPSAQEELGLYMLNTRAQNQLLSIRKLLPQDLIMRVYFKAVEAFKRDGEERFKIVYAKAGDIEKFLKSKCSFYSNYDDQSQVVSQLGNSIINNNTYERKGKLMKKSLNSDKFKERRFVLDKDQLFYFKNEKQKEKNFNLIMLNNAKIHLLKETKLSQKFCFQIENENRKYILASKSQYDLDQWVFAIQIQIELSKDNKYITDINHVIRQKEKEVAQRDMNLVQKIFKNKNIIFNPVQPILLEFINDHFIGELLPHLTQFINLAGEKEHQSQALLKAQEIVKLIRDLNSKLQITHQQILKSVVIQDEGKSQAITIEGDHKRYKDLKPEQKIQCLFTQDELAQIEQQFQKLQDDFSNPQKVAQMDTKLFNSILLNIQKILRYNYSESFFKEKQLELLSIPNSGFKATMPRLESNSIGPDVVVLPASSLYSQQPLQTLRSTQAKNCNIFEIMLTRKEGLNSSKATASSSSLSSSQSQVSNIDRMQSIASVKKVIAAPSKVGDSNQMIQSGRDVVLQ